MAKLTTKQRKAMPASKFGMPAEKKYPMPDASHAANAKARASQQVKAGKMSMAQAKKIDAKADAMLGENDSETGMMTGPIKHKPGSRGM